MLSFVKRWETFWFYSSCPKQMRAFRFVLGLVLFFFYLSRTFDLAVFYSDQGILKLSVFSEVMSYPYRYSLLQIFTSDTALWIFHFTFLASLLSLALGFYPRVSAIVAAILHLSFLHRNMAVAYGLDSMATYFLIYLCFADYKNKPEGLSSMLGSMAYRFSQIQICIIYGYSGLEKLRGVKWWQGEAIWDVLANFQLARWDFTWVASYPLLVVVATYTTVLWEIYFPVLVWVRPCTRWVLLVGVLLHLGIALAMNIPFFAALMVSTYFLFLTPQDIEVLETLFYRLWAKLKIKVDLPGSDESYV